MSRAAAPVDPDFYGVEGSTEEDRSYAGSRYREVRDALFANPYDSLPTYRVTLRSVLSGILPWGRGYRFRQAAARTVDSRADLRWGPDRRGYRRLLHPNGVCLLGRWRITEDNPYSGSFRAGSEALCVARYSTCCTETRRGHNRSLAMVGKLWPTADPDHAEPLPTASFITQEDLGGSNTPYVNDVELRNAPDTTATKRGLGLPVFLLTGIVFMSVDKQPAHRQVYSIAELGKPPGEPTRAPEFMRLVVDEDQPRIPGEELDFRDEVLAHVGGAGGATDGGGLTFHVEVSDHGTTRGPAVWQRRHIEDWRRIGRLDFHEGVASYNGDFVIHFHHPPWRRNRNDPDSVVRS